jgi:hypothetical protein
MSAGDCATRPIVANNEVDGVTVPVDTIEGGAVATNVARPSLNTWKVLEYALTPHFFADIAPV